MTDIRKIVGYFLCLLSIVSGTILNAQINDSTLSFSELKKLSLEDLMNVKVVTSTGNEQKIIEAPSTMIVITDQLIKERGYEELDDALRDIPGIDFIHVLGAYPTIMAFRGTMGDENRRILFMIDGIIENSIMGGFEMGGPAYSLHNVQRIEIIWGPGSAVYGANAYSGVINIITKKGEDINGATFQRGFGSYNTTFEKVFIGIKKSNLDFSCSGSLYRTDGPKFSNRHPSYSDAYVDNAWSFNGKIEYTIKRSITTIGFHAFNTPMGDGTFANSPTKLLGIPSQGNENLGTSGYLSANIRGEKPSLWNPYTRTAYIRNYLEVNKKTALITRIIYRETGVSEKSYSYATDAKFNNQVVKRNIWANYSNRVLGDIVINYSPGKNHKITAGLQFYQDNLERGFREVYQDTLIDTIDHIPVSGIYSTFKPRVYTIQNNTGVFAQYVITTKFLHKTDFTLGARYDNNSIYGITFNPRSGIIIQPHEKITCKLLYGRAFRAPTNFELYSKSPVRIPNPDLKPEIMNTYDVNIIYTPSKFWIARFSIFQNNLTNVIVQDVPIGGGLRQNQNVGSTIINGFEATLDISVKTINGFLNFTYQEGKGNDGTKDDSIANIAKFKGNIGAVIQIDKLFSISIISNWVGPRTVSAKNPLGKVDGYFTTNVVISTVNLFDNRICASLNIRNLFNQRYFDPGIKDASGTTFGTVHEQPGINGLFKITLNLN